MKTTTLLPKRLLATPACIGCDYCSGCILTNLGTTPEAQACEFNDTITGYRCTNPKLCGPDKTVITVNNPSSCPYERQHGWTINSRMALIDENTRLKNKNNSLIQENKNLQTTVSEKDETIRRYRDAAAIVSEVYTTAFTAAEGETTDTAKETTDTNTDTAKDTAQPKEPKEVNQ